MRIMIEPTDQITRIDGVVVRVWNGHTEQGVRCKVFVFRVAVDADEDNSAFEAELQAMLPPGRVVDLRHVL